MVFQAVETENHTLVPVFDGDNAEAWLRSSFLRDTEGHPEEILALIGQAKQAASGTAPTSWGGNQVWVEFYPDRVVVTHQ